MAGASPVQDSVTWVEAKAGHGRATQGVAFLSKGALDLFGKGKKGWANAPKKVDFSSGVSGFREHSCKPS
jgi:hypothetical protein